MACTSASSSGRSNKESLEDCMCTICLCILIQPVTLPCGHELCMPCFKQTVEEASLTCPLCRVRISTWARKASKTKTLVNQTRWEQIQRLFPGKVQRRLDGQDDETDEEIEEKEEIDVSYRRMVQLSKPGEIREEYEAELKKLAQQQEEERQQEEQASAALIQHLCSRDEQEEEEARQRLEEIAARDAQLAEKLDQVINEEETDASESPVNQLLLEHKRNFSPYSPQPLHHLSDSSNTPTTVNPRDSLVDRVKQPFIKSSKTLENFFRRLPVANCGSEKRDIRCSSEPSTGPSENAVTSKSVEPGCIAVAHRPESAPIKAGKENLPELAVQHSLFALSKHAQIYEEIEVGETYGRDASSVVEIGETYAKDPVTGKRTNPAETVSIHSDAYSQSVAIGDDIDAGPDDDGVDEDMHRFKPIEPSCKESPCPKSGSIPLEPCVVCITPRVLFSTNKLSAASFPVDHSRVASGDIVVTGQSSVEMGFVKSKLWGRQGLDGLTKSGISASGSVAVDVMTIKRSRSTSPPMQRVLPHRRQAAYDLSDQLYRRSTLEDLRQHGCSPVHDSSSDSELVASPQRRLLRGGRWVVKDSSGRKALNVVPELDPDSTRHDNQHMQGVADGDDQEVITINSSFSLNGLDQFAQSHSPSMLEKTHCQSPSKVKSVSRSVSPASSISMISCASEASGKTSPSSWRPTGIFNPDTVPQWTEALYANSQKGKGKRLVKKSSNGIFSQRNSPKKTCSKAVTKKVDGPPKAKGLERASETLSSGEQDAEPGRGHNPPDGSDKLVRRIRSQKTSAPEIVKPAVTGKDLKPTKNADSAGGAVNKSSKSVRKKGADSKTTEHSRKNVAILQRSIKEWFSTKQTERDADANGASAPSGTVRKQNTLKKTLGSSPSKRSTPSMMTQHKSKVVNDTLSASANTTPSKSPSSTPSKRKRGLTDTKNSGSAKLRKLSPSKLLENDDPLQEFFSSEDNSDDEDEEGLSQEERDMRLALRLQREFDLADKLKLKVVRFKGTDDQYSLRKNH